MRVAFLLADPDDLHIIEATQQAGIPVPLVLMPANTPALQASPGEATVVRDTEIASSTAMLAHRIDVLMSLALPPEPGSPLRNPRWTLLCRHRSLLPRHRGLDPAWHTLDQGDAVAGVSVHLIDRLRTYDGPLLVQRPVPVDPFDTLISLRRKLAACEGELVVSALRRFAGGSTFIDQDESEATQHDRPVGREDRRLDPQQPLAQLIDRIRACDPGEAPAWFEWRDQAVGVRLWRLSRPEGSDPDSL
ncbi:MAG TPA: hypothetical protein ENK18_16200 [Deltaproteobacteria bacterium]|nr:hypothetical protein [Deltaproteobacteria bacterium]